MTITELIADLSVAARELMRALGREETTQIEINQLVRKIDEINANLIEVRTP